MTDHSEFPYGVEYQAGLLTPLGVVGWVIATALLLLLILRAREGGAARGGDAHLDQAHKVILAAARYALKQDEYGILQGAKVLRRTIELYFGGFITGAGPLGKQVKALATAMGEKDEKDDKKKGDHGGHGGHGAHAGNGGHGGGHGPHAAHASHGEHGGVPGVAAHTVQGHSITVNIGAEGEHGDHHDDEDKPLSLEEQLVALRKAVREFEAWWSNRQARLSELKMVRDALTVPRKVDAELLALLEDKKH